MQGIGDENENDDKQLNQNEPFALPPPMCRAVRVPLRCPRGCDCWVVTTSEFSQEDLPTAGSYQRMLSAEKRLIGEIFVAHHCAKREVDSTKPRATSTPIG